MRCRIRYRSLCVNPSLVQFPKKSKYNTFGIKSKAEGALETLLNYRVLGKELEALKAQHRVSFGTLHKKTYIVDFSAVVVSTQSREYWEFKGFEQLDWGWKKTCWEMAGPGPLHVYKGSYKKIFLFETIIPLNYNGPIAGEKCSKGTST